MFSTIEGFGQEGPVHLEASGRLRFALGILIGICGLRPPR